MMRDVEAVLDRRSPLAVTVFRMVFGLLFACHGLSKIVGWPLAATVPFAEWPLYFAGWIELVTGALIGAGLFTRTAAFVACGEMAVAYLTHLPHGWMPLTNHGELAVLYCFAFLLLVFIGGGACALDTRWRGRRGLLRR